MEDKDKIKEDLVNKISELAALFAEYTKVNELDAYECLLEFMYAEGEGRIRVTDSRYKRQTDGKLKRIGEQGPGVSSLDDAESARNHGGAKPEKIKGPSPEQVVADLMKKLRLKG